MNEIKQQLEERYLKIGEYYNLTFDILKKIFIKNNILLIFFIILNVSGRLITEKYRGFLKTLEILRSNNMIGIRDYWYSAMVVLIISVILLLISGVILEKTGAIIEESEKKSLGETILKFFKIFCTAFALLIVIMILIVIIWIIIFIVYFIISGTADITLSNMKNISTINFLIYVMLFVTGVIFILKTLYFVQIYFLRRVSMYEALIYNFHLCKKNKMRIILPVILLVILNILLSLPFNILNFATLFSKYRFLIIGISAILSSLLNIFYLILISVIYLNVEYMDLKKS